MADLVCPTCAVVLTTATERCPSCDVSREAIERWSRGGQPGTLEAPHLEGTEAVGDPDEMRLWTPFDGGPFSPRTMRMIQYGLPIALFVGAWAWILLSD